MGPVGRNGWVEGLRHLASPHCDDRPPGEAVTLVVLHSISLPPGDFGGDAVEQLFTGCLDPAAHPYFRGLAGLRVSAHFFLRRDGAVIQFVPVTRRAWHAGASSWRGRERCNDYSVGIELEGCDDTPFSDRQYGALAQLVRLLRVPLPISGVAAHSDVAPGRKTDPGTRFEWPRLLADLAQA